VEAAPGRHGRLRSSWVALLYPFCLPSGHGISSCDRDANFVGPSRCQMMMANSL
jgi:hypothetical protein